MDYSIDLTNYIKCIIETNQDNSNCTYSYYTKFNYIILES